MTAFALFLGLVVVTAILLLAGLWRLRSRTRGLPLPHSTVLTKLANAEYRPTTRLFIPQDREFLRHQTGFRPKMERRLRQFRRQVLLLYLQEMRTKFRLLEKCCRALIRNTRDAELASLAYRQMIVFYGLLLALQMRCLLSAFVYVHIDTTGLIATLQSLQQGARSVINSRQQHGFTNWAPDR